MKRALMLAAVLVSLTLLCARAEEARALYDKQCAKCHGPDGKGDTKMGKKVGVKDYTDPKVQAEVKDEAAVKAIKEGLKHGEKTLMKPAEGLSDADIKALLALMRGFKK